MNDNDVLTECKWGNQKLVNLYINLSLIHCLYYSFDREKVGQLIDLITKMPPEECTHDRGHK